MIENFPSMGNTLCLILSTANKQTKTQDKQMKTIQPKYLKSGALLR
jgi:hypothetical protein